MCILTIEMIACTLVIAAIRRCLCIFVLPLFVDVLVARSEVELESHTVVANGQVQLANAVVAAPSIEVSVRVLGIDLDHAAEVLHCLLVAGQPLV